MSKLQTGHGATMLHQLLSEADTKFMVFSEEVSGCNICFKERSGFEIYDEFWACILFKKKIKLLVISMTFISGFFSQIVFNSQNGSGWTLFLFNTIPMLGKCQFSINWLVTIWKLTDFQCQYSRAKFPPKINRCVKKKSIRKHSNHSCLFQSRRYDKNQW